MLKKKHQPLSQITSVRLWNILTDHNSSLAMKSQSEKDRNYQTSKARLCISPSLHVVLLMVAIMRPWGCTMSCSSRPCTASVTLSSPENGFLWQSPSRWLAPMPKLRWATVSPEPRVSLISLLIEPPRQILAIRGYILREGQRSCSSWRFAATYVGCVDVMTDPNHVECLGLCQ